MSTFSALNIGKSGIFTQKKALEVASHNIANVSTRGYSRQNAVIMNNRPYMITGMYGSSITNQVGAGATVSQIEQYRDSFIDAKITTETSTLAWKDTADTMMKHIETIINEPGVSNIREDLTKFWSAWENLSNDASDTSLRRNLVEESNSLIEKFKEIDEQLRSLQGSPKSTYIGSIEKELHNTVGEVNKLGSLIADLNGMISRSEANNNQANDLRDQRQLALEELSKLVKIDSFYNDDGFLNVSAGTHQLVQHTYFNGLSVVNKNSDSGSTISGNDKYPEFSDNVEVATATLTHTTDQRNITLSVSQLAQSHSQYSFLTFHPLTGALSNFGITSGNFSVNGREFFLDAENTDMNGLSKMLDEANLNLTADINEAGQLSLNSTQTGAEYEIISENGSSNLFTVLNLKDETVAQDAKFSFDGNEYTSSENTVTDAIDGVTLFLNGIGVADLDLKPVVTGGKLKGLLEVRDGALQTAIDDLNKLAYTIVVETNQVHRTGYGLDQESGRNFFKNIEYQDINNPYKDAIQNMELEEYISSDLNSIASAGGTFTKEGDRIRTYNGDGDGSIAIKIAQLKDAKLFNDDKSTFSDFYNQTVTEVVSISSRYEAEANYSNSVISQLDAKRAELSGVSLDEELANLIKFQHAYNAAARIITVADEMLDKVINGMI